MGQTQPKDSEMTKSIFQKQNSQSFEFVHEYELTLAIGFSEPIDYITSWDWYSTGMDPSIIPSQFLRDRCYSLSKETYIAIDNANATGGETFAEILELATSSDCTKLLIKTFDFKTQMKKLCNSQFMKLSDQVIRKVQVNILFRLYKGITNKEFQNFLNQATEMKKFYGNLNTIVLDIRPLHLSEAFSVFDLFSRIQPVIAHEIEIVLNFREADTIDSLYSLIKYIHILTKCLSMDINVVGKSTQLFENVAKAIRIMAVQEPHIITKNCALSAFSLRFPEVFDVQQNAKLLGQNIQDLMQIAFQVQQKMYFFQKNPSNEVLRAYNLDLTNMILDDRGYETLFETFGMFGDPKIVNHNNQLVGSFINLSLKNLKLSEYLLHHLTTMSKVLNFNIERQSLQYLGLNFSKSNFHQIDELNAWLFNTCKESQQYKYAFQNVNLNLNGLHLNEFIMQSFIQNMIKCFNLAIESHMNDMIFRQFILTLADTVVKHFTEFLDKLFRTAKQQFHKCFQTFYLDISDSNMSEFGMNYVFQCFRGRFEYLKKKKLKQNPDIFSTFMLKIKQVNEYSLKGFDQMCEKLASIFEVIPRNHNFFKIFYLDLSQNKMTPIQVGQLIKGLDYFVKAAQYSQNFITDFGLMLGSTEIKSAQCNHIFEALLGILSAVSQDKANKTFRSLQLDMSNNDKVEDLSQFGQLIQMLSIANSVNHTTFSTFHISFAGTELDIQSLTSLPNSIKMIYQQVQQRSTILQNLRMDFSNCRLRQRSLQSILEALINLYHLTVSQPVKKIVFKNIQLNVSTLNNIKLDLSGSEVGLDESKLLSRFLSNMFQSGSSNPNTFSYFYLNLLNCGGTLTSFAESILVLKKQQMPRQLITLRIDIGGQQIEEVNEFLGLINSKNQVLL